MGAFNRAVDANASEKISYFLLRMYDFDYDPRSIRSFEDSASSVAYHLRRSNRAELYRLYLQDERDDRAEAWSKVSDRAIRALVPAAALLAFAGAMWWALAAFGERGRPEASRRGFVRLWLILSAAWMFSYAVLVPLLEPPGPFLTIHAYGRRGCEPIQIRSPRLGWNDEQELVSWMIGLLIAPVVLMPLLAAWEAARSDQGKRWR